MLNESTVSKVPWAKGWCASPRPSVGAGLVPARKGAGVGYLTLRLFLLSSPMTLSVLWVWKRSLGVEVSAPNPDPFVDMREASPYDFGGGATSGATVGTCFMHVRI